MRKFLRVLGFVAAGLAAPAAGSAETLADALAAAYRSSNLLDQNQAVLRAADEDAAIAMSTLRPVIAYAASGGWSKTYGVFESEGSSASLELTASMLIWEGGKNRLSLASAREQVLSARAALVNVEQQVLLDAVTAYVNVRLQNEIVALRESNVRVITQELRAARDRFEVGEVTQTDVALAEAALAASRANLAAAQGELMVAREQYKSATGAYPGRLAALPKSPRLPKSLDEAKSVAERTHPAIKQGQHQVTVSDLNLQIAKTAFGPRLSGEIAAEDNLNRDSTDLTVGLRLDQTLYAGGRNSAIYRKALAGKDAAQSALLQTTVEVTEGVGRAWARIAVSAASIDAGRQQVTAAQRAFEGVREEATLGARTTLDVLNAEQDLLSARASRLEAEANLYIGVYNLLATMGLLTAEHLNLGVPTFDPEAYYNAVKNAPATSAQGKALDRILKKIGD